MGRIRRNGRRGDPTFALELWNMCARSRDELSRTNYIIEGWHRKLQFHIDASRINLYNFFDALKREENITRVDIAQLLGDNGNNVQNMQTVMLVL